MANWVLTQLGTVISCCSLRQLTANVLFDSNEVEAHQRSLYTADITQRLGYSVKLPVGPLPEIAEPDWDAEPYGDDLTPEHEPFVADLVDEE